MPSLSNTSSLSLFAYPLRKVHAILLVAFVVFVSAVAAINGQMALMLFGVVGIIGLLWMMNDPRVRFISILVVVLIHQVYATNPAIKEYTGAVVFVYGVIDIFIRRKLWRRLPLAPSPLYFGFLLFFAWGTIIGFFGILDGSISVEIWIRELLTYAPFLLLPIYYVEIIDAGYDEWRLLVRYIILLWMVVFVLEVIKIRSNLAQAVYLFQLGVARFDTNINPFMMFLVLSAAMTLPRKKRSLLIVGFLLAVVSLILAFMRTAWVWGFLSLPLVLLLGKKSERKQGFRFMLWVLCIGVVALTIGYFFIPGVRLGITYVLIKFSGATVGAKSDISLYNRFVEWRAVTAAIADAPLTGHGFGALYSDYDWLLGISKMYHYTHNAYLGLLLKTGIIGMVLIMIPYVGYFVKGIGYYFSNYITQSERIYMRAALVFIFFLSLSGYTINIFFERTHSFHIALFWSFCIGLEYKIRQRKASHTWPGGQVTG